MTTSATTITRAVPPPSWLTIRDFGEWFRPYGLLSSAPLGFVPCSLFPVPCSLAPTPFFGGFRNEVAELGEDQLVHRQADGCGGAWHRQHDHLAEQAAGGAAQHCCRTDFFVTQRAKQFAITGQRPGQQLIDRFECLVAWADAGAAGQENRLHVATVAVRDDRLPDSLWFIGHQDSVGNSMPVRFEHFAHQRSRAIGLDRAGIADGNHRARDRARGLGAVLLDPWRRLVRLT